MRLRLNTLQNKRMIRGCLNLLVSVSVLHRQTLPGIRHLPSKNPGNLSLLLQIRRFKMPKDEVVTGWWLVVSHAVRQCDAHPDQEPKVP